MDWSFANIALVLGGVTTGMHAGLLYDWSVNVVPSLRKLSPKRHIETFQVMNKTIENPVFFISFLGPIIFLPLAAFFFRGTPRFSWLLAAALVQIIGSNIVTISQHLPRNAQLAKVQASRLNDTEADKIRQDFQGRGSKWTGWHTVRTLASISATALVFIAAISS